MNSTANRYEPEVQAPPSPVLKTDGISLRAPHLSRTDIVNEIISTARSKQHVVVGAPPATGKTALLQLVRESLLKGGAKVVDVDIRNDGVDKLYSDVAAEGIVTQKSKLRELKNTWLLLDDSQNAYSTQYYPFWQFIVKTIQGLGDECDLRVIISTTYDLSTSTPISPVQFSDLEHVHANISQDEAVELFNMFARVWRYEDWRIYRQTLIDVSKLSDDNFHVGVIIGGIRMLDRCRKLPGAGAGIFDEPKALSNLRSAHFIDRLDRAFRLPDDFHSAPGRGPLLDAVLAKSPAIQTDDSALSPLIRAGILDSYGIFSSVASQWYYNRRCFPSRADVTPESLDALVIQAVRRMSAKRLRDTLENGFPKEATFQHLFNEAMSTLLPLTNYIIPELSTFAFDSSGNLVSGELDFYINGDLQWCLEILRLGDKIGQHLSRFDYEEGKYREVQTREYLIVDCRGEKGARGAEVNEARCTLYFAGNFDSCICKMRTREELELRLAP